ncbi:MAG TPA: serine hydrolase domain-containing protein, partial [Verrucomicrobiae bacterium]|nr:serine hydrolase domain-containing protein [Verrucomicrobiae bacterium]
MAALTQAIAQTVGRPLKWDIDNLTVGQFLPYGARMRRCGVQRGPMRHSKLRQLVLGACAVLLGLPMSEAARAQTAPPQEAQRLNPEDVGAFMDGLVQAQLAANRIPGATVAVTQDDRVVLMRGYGEADIASNTAVDPERSLFRVASVSKPFVWMSVLQLRDRGLLDLDQDVNTYLDFAIPDTYPGHPVTLRHLLTHTAGFEDANIGGSVRTAAEREPLGDTVRRMLPRRTAPPGQRTSYSNYGAALAGYIVERTSGMPLTEYLEANIFTPLGMAHTSMRQPLPDNLAATLATGYTLRDDQIANGSFEFMNLYPNGALSTTAGDMARFAIAHLAGAQDTNLLSPTSWNEMHTRQFGNIAQASGLTYGFEQSLWNGHIAFGHGGDIATFKTHFVMFPESRISIFISFNSDHTGGAGPDIISAFADRYLPGPDTFLFSVLPVEHATDEVEGAFVSTRRSASTIEKLYWPIATGVNITRLSATELDVQFFGRHRRYVRESVGVYVPAQGEQGASDSFGALVARQSPTTGQTEIFFTEIGAFMFERPAPADSLGLHAMVLVGSLSAAFIG